MTARPCYALLAAASAAFVVYGSLVPFHFHARPKRDGLPAFRWCMTHRLWPQSRSDGLANFALGVPLGFALLGACRAGRPGVPWEGPLLLAGCVGLAAAVEFAQLFIPERTCAGSDVVAQGLGAAVGLVGWWLLGERATRFAAAAAHHPRAGGRAGRLLAAYLAVVAGVQLLPLDLTASPVEVYRRLRDGKATLVPFGEGLSGDTAAKWLTLAGLFVPVGLLAARIPTLTAGPGIAGGFAAAALTEAGQLLVSRHASTTDAMVGGMGAMVGWAVVRWVRVPPAGLAAAWLGLLAAVWWQPFDFGPTAGAVNWLPFADLLAADYLHDADVMATRVLLFAPLGALAGRRGWLLAGVAATALEAGQVFLPGRYPSVTDVVLAVLGGALGGLGRRWATGGRA